MFIERQRVFSSLKLASYPVFILGFLLTAFYAFINPTPLWAKWTIIISLTFSTVAWTIAKIFEISWRGFWDKKGKELLAIVLSIASVALLAFITSWDGQTVMIWVATTLVVVSGSLVPMNEHTAEKYVFYLFAVAMIAVAVMFSVFRGSVVL